MIRVAKEMFARVLSYLAESLEEEARMTYKFYEI